MNRRAHIFISYARSDGETFARELHARLESEQLACWRDRLDLVGGEDFWRQLQAGISDARWIVIVLTPGALRSKWTATEWREARKRGVPVCPVWPLGAEALSHELDRSALPAAMRRSHVYKPFAGNDEHPARANEEWKNLVATLRTDREVTRELFMAPPLPPDYVERPAQMTALLNALLSSNPSSGAARLTTTLRGAPGMGKTTLATAVARRDEVKEAFFGGTLWVTLGPHPDLREKVAALCSALSGEDLAFHDLDTASNHLQGLLEHLPYLLVLDDVWRFSDLHAFTGIGPSVSTLVTTRADQVATAEKHALLNIREMTDEEAVGVLLSATSGEQRLALLDPYRRLAARIGRWPLLLRLAGGQLRAQLEKGETVERACAWIEASLRDVGATAFDQGSTRDFDDPRTRVQAVAACVGGSLRLLESTGRRAFLDLGIFPEGAPIPLTTAGQLWGGADAKKTALSLAGLSLVDVRLGDQPVITLHDQILSYAAGRLRADKLWAKTHGRLVDAWRDPGAPPDGYSWRWVCRHLKEAGRTETLHNLLFDFAAVERRLRTRSVGIHRLVTDYSLLNDRDGAHVHRVLSGAVHILARRPDLLAQQLVGRMTLDTPECQRLVAAARASVPPGVLLPRTPSITSPVGLVRPLLRLQAGLQRLLPTRDGRLVTGGADGLVYCVALEGGDPVLLLRHETVVNHVALTGDGRVVTSGGDGRVYCVSLDANEPQLLARHDASVWQLVLTDDHRVVSGGYDGRVYCACLDGGEPVLLATHQGGARQLALTDDGRVVTGGQDGQVFCVPLDGGAPTPIARHEGPVEVIGIAKNRSVVSTGMDGRVLCMTLDGGEPLLLTQHDGRVEQLALTHDGRVVTGGSDGSVFCARLDGKVAKPVLLARHRYPVSQLAVVGSRLALSAGGDGRVLCAALDGGEPTLVADHHNLVTFALTNDDRVVTGGSDGRACCSRLNGRDQVVLAQFDSAITRIALTGEGRALIVVFGRVYCVPLDGGEPVLVAQHEHSVNHLTITDDGRVVTGDSHGVVNCATLDAARPERPVRHEGAVWHLALTGDGRVVSAGEDGRVYCRSLGGGTPRLLHRHDRWVRCLALTNDGRVVTSGMDGRVCCVRADGGTPVTLARHEGEAWRLELTGDGRVVTGGSDGRAYCSTLDGGEPLLLARHEKRIERLALTDDGRVVTGGDDGRVYCARLNGGDPVLVVRHDGPVQALALTRDGRVVSGGNDGSVYCADLGGGRAVPMLPFVARSPVLHVSVWREHAAIAIGASVISISLAGGRPAALVDHDEWVRQLAVTDDGHVVSAADDGRIYSVPIAGGEPLLLAHHEGRARRIALAPGGRVVSAGADGRVYCARPDGGAPVLLARHEGAVRLLTMISDTWLLSGGTEALFLNDVCDLSRPEPIGVFLCDYGFVAAIYDAAHESIVATDALGSLHILSAHVAAGSP